MTAVQSGTERVELKRIQGDAHPDFHQVIANEVRGGNWSGRACRDRQRERNRMAVGVSTRRPRLDPATQAMRASDGRGQGRNRRAGLNALRAAAPEGVFDVVLVDDLSRLARNTLLLLTTLEELRFTAYEFVSVADGLDSDDREATIGIQMRGVFNELQLQDLRKKTLRGQIGQKTRGFTVGEATFGYRSVAVGTIRLDKKGRPRPDGYE